MKELFEVLYRFSLVMAIGYRLGGWSAAVTAALILVFLTNEFHLCRSAIRGGR